MAWILTIRNGRNKTTKLGQSIDDWNKARQLTKRMPSTKNYSEGDFAYRNRAWSAYIGRNVIDWEWED